MTESHMRMACPITGEEKELTCLHRRSARAETVGLREVLSLRLAELVRFGNVHAALVVAEDQQFAVGFDLGVDASRIPSRLRLMACLEA